MKTPRLFVASVAALAVTTSLAIAADLKSGPQAGEKLPGSFHPLNINGENAGKKHCLFCEYGPLPVAMIFAREITPELTSLIKEIDAVNVKQKDNMGSFVVFLGTKDDLEKSLRTVAEKEKLQRCILTIDSPANVAEHNLAKEAAVTVVLYREAKVMSNFAFRKGELKAMDVAKVVRSLPVILAE